MEELENGCLGVWEQNSDFLIEWFEDNLPTLYQQDDIIYEYNQFKSEWSKKAVLYSQPLVLFQIYSTMSLAMKKSKR